MPAFDPSIIRDCPPEQFVHEALFFTPPSGVPLQGLLSALAREMDKRSADGWEVMGAPMPLAMGAQVIGGEPKVTWVIWSRRPVVAGELPMPEREAAGREKGGLIETVGLQRQSVEA